jgi:hypothetical protein
MSKGKPWYLDVDIKEHHIYLYKDGKKLCQEGGPASGKEYGHVCQLTGLHQKTESEGLLLRVDYTSTTCMHRCDTATDVSIIIIVIIITATYNVTFINMHAHSLSSLRGNQEDSRPPPSIGKNQIFLSFSTSRE